MIKDFTEHSGTQMASPLTAQPDTNANPSLKLPPPAVLRFDEYEYSIAAAIALNEAFALQVPLNLPCRKLYGSIWTNPTNNVENWVTTEIRFWRNGSIVGVLPWGIGNSTSQLSRIIPSPLNGAPGNGTSVQDDIILTVDNTGIWIQGSAILHPLDFYGIIDRITLAVQNVYNVANMRIYLACLSTADNQSTQ